MWPCSTLVAGGRRDRSTWRGRGSMAGGAMWSPICGPAGGRRRAGALALRSMGSGQSCCSYSRFGGACRVQWFETAYILELAEMWLGLGALPAGEGLDAGEPAGDGGEVGEGELGLVGVHEDRGCAEVGDGAAFADEEVALGQVRVEDGGPAAEVGFGCG